MEEFASAENWPALLTAPVEALIDACDQSHAKLALAAWALRAKVPLVVVGAAGGKQRAQAVEVADLADTTHDPLLAGLRQRLRRQLREAGQRADGRLGLPCVFSREAVAVPADAACAVDGSLKLPWLRLQCDPSPATFGLVAAGEGAARTGRAA